MGGGEQPSEDRLVRNDLNDQSRFWWVGMDFQLEDGKSRMKGSSLKGYLAPDMPIRLVKPPSQRSCFSQ